MAIALAGTPTLVENATSATIAVTVPAGTTTGEVLICAVAASRTATGDTLNAPAGFTQLALVKDTATTGVLTGLYYRVADGSEAASYTWTNTAATAGRIGGAMQRFTGVNTTTVPDATATTSAGTVSTDPVLAPSITTVTANTMMVSLACVQASTSTALTAPGTVTVINTTGDGGGRRMSWGTEAIAATGTTGTRLWTKTVPAQAAGWATITAALRPGASSPAIPPILVMQTRRSY